MIVLTLHTQAGHEAARITADRINGWSWSGKWGSGSGRAETVARSVCNHADRRSGWRVVEESINQRLEALKPEMQGEGMLQAFEDVQALIHLKHAL